MKKRMNTVAVAIASVILGATAATAVTSYADTTSEPGCCCNPTESPSPTDEPTEPTQSPSPTETGEATSGGTG